MRAGPEISTRSILIVALGLLLAVAICYSALPQQEFVDCWDDSSYVTQNPDVHDFNLGNLVTRPYEAMYLPLTMITLAVEYRLWGENPLPYKLTNVFLHLASSLLVVLLVWRLFPGRVGLGVFSGFVFAVHPQHVESVAVVAERKDVLSVLLALLSLWFYLDVIGGSAAARLRNRRYLLSLFCFALGLFAKPMVVTLPVLLLLVDLYRDGRVTKDSLLTKLPYLALSLVFGLISLRTQVGDPSAVAAYPPAPPYTFIEAIAFYAWKGVLPTGLSAVYQRSALDLGAAPWVLALALVGMGAWAWRFAPQARRGLVFSAGFFLVTITLVSGLIPFSSWQFAADRYFYLPSLGFFLFLGLVVNEIFDRAPGSVRSKRLLLGALSAAYCVGLGVQCLDRMQVWRDCESLYVDAVQKYPRADFAQYQLAVTYYANGDFERAVHHMEEALFWQPDNAPATFVLAFWLDLHGDIQEARALYEQTLVLYPAAWWAHHHLGRLYLKQGQWDSAAEHLEQAYAAAPDDLANCHFLGVALGRIGQPSRALRTLQTCLSLGSNHAGTLAELARLYLERGQPRKARSSLEAAKRRGYRADPAFEARLRREVLEGRPAGD